MQRRDDHVGARLEELFEQAAALDEGQPRRVGAVHLQHVEGHERGGAVATGESPERGAPAVLEDHDLTVEHGRPGVDLAGYRRQLGPAGGEIEAVRALHAKGRAGRRVDEHDGAIAVPLDLEPPTALVVR